jgi:hypothetical protein
MKYIITESQYRFLTEDEEQKILKLPGLDYIGGWEGLELILNNRKNPLFSIDGDFRLRRSKIKSLNNLVSVGDNLDLYKTPINSLNKLEKVGGYLDLYGSKIENLGNLEKVGGYLDLEYTPLSKMYSEEQIREMVDVGANIYLQ